jgi:hypothetical protein
VANTVACTNPPGGGGLPGTCANTNDLCCANAAGACFAPAGGTAVNCCPGANGDTFCKTQLTDTTATCTLNNTCTSCKPVATTGTAANPIQYFVDPVNGSDGATGSAENANGTANEKCALKTITRALKLIGVVGTAVPTQIVIVGGGGATVGAGETFPFIIPSNLSVTSKTGAVTVQVASGHPGFVLGNPSSSIASGAGAPITITTTVTAGPPATGGTFGIAVTGAATAATTSISEVTVTGMLADGIAVAKGSVTIGAGVVSTANGIPTTGPLHDGLRVLGSGAAVINVPSGQAPSNFDKNTGRGITVEGLGSVTITGAVTSATMGTGTVTANGNNVAGIWIQQTPGAALTQNKITGLVSFANTGGPGMRIIAGSSVHVRSSVFNANQGDGVLISTSGAGATANNDITLIDLGKTGDLGGNTFQGPLSGVHNGRAGVCLTTASGGATLAAEGNIFSAATCTAGTPTLTLNKNSCANSNGQCMTGVCDLGLQTLTVGTANKFDVTTCTQ